MNPCFRVHGAPPGDVPRNQSPRQDRTTGTSTDHAAAENRLGFGHFKPRHGVSRLHILYNVPVRSGPTRSCAPLQGSRALKLVSVTVENFRSITAARKIPIANLTTLVGPNNEGKSNILRALVIGMNLLVQRRLGAPRFRRPILRRHSHDRVNPYNWAQDYPLKMQKREPPGGSAITLEFELTDDDISDFGSTLGSKINGTLPISFILHKDELRVSIAKPGRGHKTLNSESAAYC